MILVIAEKPSVAQSIAKVLGATSRRDGYLEGNNYIVSWCVGHLVELADASSYDERYAKWRYEDLPIVPEEWLYEVPKDKSQQFKVLRDLMKDKRVTELVCATDAGREGELIFRLVYNKAGCTKPFKRLWISSLEDSAIREGFAHLRDSREFDRLYEAALCRSKADWIVGINDTRLFTTLYHKKLVVGRVQTPTLAMLAERDGKISTFKKEKYFNVHVSGSNLTADMEKVKTENEAKTIAAACDKKQAVVSLVCNEEGKLEGLPLNRALRDEDGDIYDVVAGTFMVVGLTDDSFGSLTVEQMQKFSDHFKVPEQFAKLGDKIVAIPMISKEQQKQEVAQQKDFEMNADTSGLTVAGHIGTWHTIDQHEIGGHSFYLMEHDTYGDEAACIIVDERGKLVLDDVYNGFDDDTLRLLDLEVKEVPEMPDSAISVQDMKDYGYTWAGVLPAGQEAAEKALEMGCEVYRLYSDNTEGLCVDAKEIADHAAKGGMLGISKESWMAALEKENYLKAAEMSMEDDYGMIDGIINNGPKEDKTAEVKAPERGEKSSIMDRLKSAKAEKQKECCPPKKHKGEIEL